MGASICCFMAQPDVRVPNKDQTEFLEIAQFDTMHSLTGEPKSSDRRYIVSEPWNTRSLSGRQSRAPIPLHKQLTTIQEEVVPISPTRKREKTISTRSPSYNSLVGLSSSRGRTISSSDDDLFVSESFASMRNYQRFVARNNASI